MDKNGKPIAMSPQKEQYYKKVFEKLDHDNNGKIDLNDLKNAFEASGHPLVPGQAEVSGFIIVNNIK